MTGEMTSNPELSREILKDAEAQYEKLEQEFNELIGDKQFITDTNEIIAIRATINHKGEKLKRLIFDLTLEAKNFDALIEKLENQLAPAMEAAEDIGMPVFIEPIFEDVFGYEMGQRELPKEFQNLLDALIKENGLETFTPTEENEATTEE